MDLKSKHFPSLGPNHNAENSKPNCATVSSSHSASVPDTVGHHTTQPSLSGPSQVICRNKTQPAMTEPYQVQSMHHLSRRTGKLCAVEPGVLHMQEMAETGPPQQFFEREEQFACLKEHSHLGDITGRVEMTLIRIYLSMCDTDHHSTQPPRVCNAPHFKPALSEPGSLWEFVP